MNQTPPDYRLKLAARVILAARPPLSRRVGWRLHIRWQAGGHQRPENPRNCDVVSKAPALVEKTIVVEVVESHRCNSRHKVGDRIIFDGGGNLPAKHSPGKICAYAIHDAVPVIHAANELIFSAIDPNQMRFQGAACMDLGEQCGRWGRIVLELGVQDRN